MTWPSYLSIAMNEEEYDCYEDTKVFEDEEYQYDEEWERIEEERFWGYKYR